MSITYTIGTAHIGGFVTNDGFFVPIFGVFEVDGGVNWDHIRELVATIRRNRQSYAISSVKVDPQRQQIEVTFDSGRVVSAGIINLIGEALVEFVKANKTTLDAYQNDTRTDLYTEYDSDDLIPFETAVLTKSR